MNNVRCIAVKELFGFFSSLTAFIFFGVFLAVTLFIFFWVDTFFSRNIADVRPIFEWLPVLMIFLAPALTMRMWSEERRSGTLEFLLTVPVSNLELVLGKFVACMGLILIALALTLPIPITVALLAGQLDWGPVIGGYVAALFLAASYTAIGLNISARTDNQIVSLMLSVLVCGLFLLIGSDGLTTFFSSNVGEFLKLLGSGSRFQSITRGVIDFRDLYYYASITAVFLSLNTLGLEKMRWCGNKSNSRHREWLIITSLCIANFVAGNFWLQQISWARIDITQGQIYSISPATRIYLERLKEPLLIRGYFSKKTHPLLQPLVPRLRDLLKEYAIAGKGKVRVEFVDPLESPELEKEAVQKYGIKPVIFQTASKYQAALTNSYFDILIKYGDQFQTLSWKSLIEAKAHSDTNIDVDLRNPEYDITSAIKKLLYSYQSSGNLFLDIDKPITFTGYISSEANLPGPLRTLKTMLDEELAELKKQANGKLSIEFIDPDADGGKLAEKIKADYGFRPMTLGVTDPRTFWFYMTLKSGRQQVQVVLPSAIEKDTLKRNIEAALKRFSKGFLKTIGICSPQSDQTAMGGGGGLVTLNERLGDAYAVENVSLDKGSVPSDVDLLVLVAPAKITERQLFAIDQFLMKGGTIVLITSPFDVGIERKMQSRNVDSGLSGWLKSLGINIRDVLVADRQNFPLPIPIRRMVAGLPMEETRLVPYPFFVDVRDDGISSHNPILADIDQVILAWPSTIEVEKRSNQQRHVTELLRSSAQSWTTNGRIIEPHYQPDQPLGFSVGKDLGPKLLAVAVEGSFPSYFKGKTPPALDTSSTNKAATTAPARPANEAPATNVIDKSPESARLVVFASNSFVADKIMWLAGESIGSRYIKPVEVIQNVADWSLGDQDLLSIRGRGHFARTLRSMNQGFEVSFEYLNYGLAAVGLLVVWIMRRRLWSRSQKRYEQLLVPPTKQPVPDLEEAKQ